MSDSQPPSFHPLTEPVPSIPPLPEPTNLGPTNLRQFVPQTSDAVPALLRGVLDLAIAGKLRGVVVLYAFHDRSPMGQGTAGDLSLAEAVLLLEHWKHQMLHGQASRDSIAP